jgi:hypothetical protein
MVGIHGGADAALNATISSRQLPCQLLRQITPQYCPTALEHKQNFRMRKF